MMHSASYYAYPYNVPMHNINPHLNHQTAHLHHQQVQIPQVILHKFLLSLYIIVEILKKN